MKRFAALIGLIAAAPAFAADEMTATPGNALEVPPVVWLGETPHLVVMGTVDGYGFDIQAEDVAAIEGLHAFEGRRTYLEGDGGDAFVGLDLTLEVVLDGVEKTIELAFENAGFAGNALPADFALGDAADMTFGFKWENRGVSVHDHATGWTGTLSLKIDRGVPDALGLKPDGLVGGHVSATRGDDRLAISFTVPMVDYELED